MAQVVVGIGTQKGLFFITSDENRKNWALGAPQLPGWEVSALHFEPGATGRIYIGTTHYAYGATVRVTDDFGQTWNQTPTSPVYAKESPYKSNRIWQITTDPNDVSKVYAGIDEAGLFVSQDRGQTWEEVTSLTQLPSRPHWHPGAGGLCLHTIVIDPQNSQRIWLGISAVGVFRSTDGGKSWKACNVGLPAFESGNEQLPFIHCVHKIVADPASADTLYMQFHGGVLKSTDAADSWHKIESGLPGNFGFPLAISKAGELFVAPLENEMSRVMKEGKLTIYRSRDAGASWQGLIRGLPTDPRYVGVLRDSMACDSLSPAGVCFGTSMGEVYFSANAGDDWQRLPGQFPRIETIKIAVR